MSKVMIRDHGTALFQSHIPGTSRQHQTTAADGGHCYLANTLHKMREITFFKGCSYGPYFFAWTLTMIDHNNSMIPCTEDWQLWFDCSFVNFAAHSFFALYLLDLTARPPFYPVNKNSRKGCIKIPQPHSNKFSHIKCTSPLLYNL